MEERMHTLETQQRLFNASIKGGSLQVLRGEDAKLVANIGVGTYGSTIPRTAEIITFLDAGNNNTTFHLLLDEKYGWVLPRWHFNFVADTFIVVTSGSYINTWKTSLNITAQCLVVQLFITCDAGTTGKVRLDLNSRTTDEITINPSEQKFCKFSWDLRGKYDFGSDLTLRIQNFRVSGAGNVNVYAPDACYLTSAFDRSDMTTGGIASV
jgi:hypothetical protein